MTGTGSEVDELLRLLRSRDVRLEVRGSRLDYDAPAEALDAGLIATMRRLKPDLVDRLRATDPPDPGLGNGPGPDDGGSGPTDGSGPDDGGGGDVQVLATAPASFGQARQYRLTVDSDTPQMLTVALRFALRGPLDRPALERALTDLTVRHAVLRTRYAMRGAEVWQEVLAARPVPVPVRSVAPGQLDDAAREWAGVPFALRVEPGFRAVLFRPEPTAPTGGTGTARDQDRHELVLALHHGIVDGWSAQVLIRDLGELYRAAVTGEPSGLPPPAADFVDFSRWERGYLAQESTRRTVQAWADEVRGEVAPLRLPTDRPRVAAATDAGGHVSATVTPELVSAVAAHAVRRDVTPFVVLAAAFAWFLHRLTGAPSVPLTVPVANRSDPRFDEVVGVFAHAPWLVVPVRGAESFDALVGRTARATWQVLARQSVPLAVQSEALGDAFAGSPNRVYLSVLDLAEPVLHLLGIDPVPAEDVLLAGARADLTWHVRPTPDGGMSLVAEYAATLFDLGTVSGWVDRYLRLLPRLLAAPDAPLPRHDEGEPA
ncbi:condensation domain-containing protein [Micromonospora rubida]|uniref:Condensation domain-containing protein n=1 Tax=Micromonospora rubida TaxID=2697657 RepID=A0ABW7SPZ0_9ACTN